MQSPRCSACKMADWQTRAYELIRFRDAPGAETTGPQGAWFCPEHADLALRRAHLSTRDALAQIAQLFPETSNAQPPEAHYILLDGGSVALTKAAYGSWREIQAAWPGYKASLGPWTEADLVEYFTDDFPAEGCWPFSRAQLAAYFASNDDTTVSPPK